MSEAPPALTIRVAVGRASFAPSCRQEGSLIQLTSLKLPEKASRGLNALLSEGFEDRSAGSSVARK